MAMSQGTLAFSVKKNAFDLDFDSFWSAYPKKRDKAAAQRAYKRVRKTVEHDKIMAGLERYRDEVAGKDPKFTKHPATWLNAGSWENGADDNAGYEHGLVL